MNAFFPFAFHKCQVVDGDLDSRNQASIVEV